MKSPVSRALRVLVRVVHEGGPVSLAQLSTTLRLPKPTVHRLALLLEQEGFIQKDLVSRRYVVGGALEELALDAIRNAPAHSLRRLHLQRLSEKLGESVNLAVLSGGEAVYVERVVSAQPLRTDMGAGTRVPLHCTANGKLLLAYSPPPLRQRVVRSAPFPPHTKNTIRTAAELSRELDVIRRRGYSEDKEEFLEGVCCLAVPVRDRAGHVIAGLAIMAPSARFPLGKARGYLPDLYVTADLISAQWEGAERSPPAAPDAGRDS